MSTTFDSLVDSVLRELYGGGLAQPRASFLTGSVNASALQFTVTDATNFEQGVAEIENEIVFIESVDFDGNVLTISPDGRGYYGTTAASHAANARITMAPTWSRTAVAEAINETITGVYPDLFGVATTSFAFNPSINTYALPADAQRVLMVTVDTIGPSREQLTVKRYSENLVASGSNFPTGKSITLEKGGFPGRNVNVTYMKSLSEITWGDDFTASGLAETAKRCIKYGACSALLTYMDSSRLPVDTAQADEVDPSKNGVGTASKVAAALYQRYTIELAAEKRRLRERTPVPVTVRTR